MRLILDAGAFIALGRDDRAMWRRLKTARLAGQLPVTHGGVVGQVWRAGGPRQALLARALEGIDVRALDEQLGRAAQSYRHLGRHRRSARPACRGYRPHRYL